MSSKPVVSIGSPQNGAQILVGQEVLVQAVAADTGGIARVELWVDGLLSAVAQPPAPQATYSGVLRWTPTSPGAHTLMARAVNTSGMTSDPAAITVNAIAQNASTVPPAATSAPPAPATASARAGDPYADRVVNFTPGNPAAPRFSDPNAAIGKPDFDKAALSGFVKLGVGGSITVEFVDNIAVDGPGPDIEIYGDPDDDEMWFAEVSADCVNFKSFGKVRERVKLDLADVGLPFARCVRLTDDGDPAGGISPGAELDAVLALNSAPPVPTITARSATLTPFIPPTPTLIPKPNEYITVAQLNLWYFGAGCHGGFEDFVHCSGRRTTPFEPALGHTYTSSNPNAIKQQIDWAADYGVDAFSLEWTTPRGIGTSGSLEDNIDDAFLKAPNLGRIRWCIFYDTVLRMTQDPAVNADVGNGINFDDRKVYAAFVSDFDHFATKYFGQPQYLKVDGRPVIYIYAAWNFHGNYAGAIQEARAKALARGYDVFIAGDALRADTFDRRLASQFDANTTFTFLIPGLPTYSDVGKTAPAIDKFFQTWRKNIQGLTVVGRKETVNFEPAWAPQFDNRMFEPTNPTYVPALSKAQVMTMAQIARDNAEPVGSLKQKLIWENTWNNWAEATTIEPTANLGAKYPAGNYQFDMLEIVREVFGAETFGNSPRAP